MSELMDAEDMSDVMSALWEQLGQVIVEHGGFIDKHIGDEVMALWGKNVLACRRGSSRQHQLKDISE